MWKPSSLSELTTIIFNMELTHLDSEAFNFNAKSELQITKYLMKKY